MGKGGRGLVQAVGGEKHGRGEERQAGPVWGNEWVRKVGQRAMQSKSPHRLVRLNTGEIVVQSSHPLPHSDPHCPRLM